MSIEDCGFSNRRILDQKHNDFSKLLVFLLGNHKRHGENGSEHLFHFLHLNLDATGTDYIVLPADDSKLLISILFLQPGMKNLKF